MLQELKGGAHRYHTQQKLRRRRFLRNLFVACFVIIAIGIGVGLFYTWMNGKNHPVASQPLPTVPKKQLTTTPQYDPSAPVGVAIEAMSPAVKAGSNVSLSVKTKPKAACSIVVTYQNNQKSTDAGLIPKNADEFGVVIWTWTVEVGRPAGTWPVEVTCADGDKSGYGKADLVVASET